MHKEVFSMATYHLRLKNDTRPSGKKISAKRHADYILREDAKSHADYINREGSQNERTDCVFKGSQLPKWAKGSAQRFFAAASRYEDKGNRRYKEIELSLPNELSLEQNRLIVDKFISHHLANHYHAYAIHLKAGELSGELHPHVHIMFSERLIDDVERTNERPACKYFRRAAKPLKGETVASFERRREHGAPKDKKWHDKKFLLVLREDFALIQNEVLAENGFSIRVDHRSLKVQQQEAQENSDQFLAQLCNRMPESFIGVVTAHSNNLTTDLKKARIDTQVKQTSLFLDDLNQKLQLELETKALVRRVELAHLNLIHSNAYRSANFDEPTLRALNDSITLCLTKIRQLKRNLVSVNKAHQRAQAEYLTAAERKFLFDYKNTLGQKINLEKLLAQLEAMSYKTPANQQAAMQIQCAIQKRIADLQNFLSEQHSQFKTTQLKLQNPYRRKNIQLATHLILQDNLKTLSELKNVSNELLKHLDAMREIIEIQQVPQTVFTLSEVKASLLEHYRSLNRQYDHAIEKRNRLCFKKLTSSTALSIAKNIFAHGALKKLRLERQSYEKAKFQYERDLADTLKREFLFSSTNWTNRGDRLKAQYYLVKSKSRLDLARQKLAQTKIRLDNESERLELLCKTPAAQEKITLLAANILRRNLKFVHQFDAEKKRVAELSKKIQTAKKRLDLLKELSVTRNRNHLYRVITSESICANSASPTKNDLVTIIADALAGQSYAVQLVARSSGNNLEMDKDWTLMTELDRDQLLHKKIAREL